MLCNQAGSGDAARGAARNASRLAGPFLGLALSLLLIPLAPAPSRGAPPYPRLLTTLWNEPEPKDFGPASRFDAVEFFWTDIIGTPGYADSVRAMKARNPNLKVIAVGWCDVHCTNWPGREAVMWRWTQQMAAHDSLWYLHDTDGDYWTLDPPGTCAEGFFNWTRIDMAEAFAQYLYEDVFLAHPGVFDGIHFDALSSSIWWLQTRHWSQGGTDSMDANRDGVFDGRDSLDAWWRRGVNAFCQKMRVLAGNDYTLIVNGGIPSESFHLMNGRFHEGFPGPIGGQAPDWYRSMLDPVLGYLVEPSLYSTNPMQMLPLQGLSFFPNDCDPNHLATTETPYDIPCCMNMVRITLASALLGDGYACFTGWARPSTGPTVNYHTTWWFPLYDTLRVNLGVPLGPAYDSTTALPTQRQYKRHYTGGTVKVTYTMTPALPTPTLDLRPKAIYTESPTATSWTVGEQKTIRFRGWDPITGTSYLKVRLLLSRNGGLTFPETLAVKNATDSLATITVSGPAAANCRLRVEARDIGNMKGWTDSAPFVINGAASVSGFAEITPDSILAGLSVQGSVFALVTAAPAGGIGELRLRRPSTLSLWWPSIVTVNGAPLVGNIWPAGDSIRVVPATPWGAGTQVRVRLTLVAGTLANPAGSPVGALLVPAGAPSQGVPVPPGDADGVPGNGETLTLAVLPGPLVRVVVLPGSATVSANLMRTFIVSGRDAYNNWVPVSPAWSVIGGIGTISSGGLFHALTAGIGGIRGSALGFADTAEVTVTPGPAARVQVTPDSLTFFLGQEAQFAAVIYDAVGNQVPGSIVWSVTGPATLAAPGRLFGAGLGTGSIIATSAALADSAKYRVKQSSENGEATDVAAVPATLIDGLAVWPSPVRPGTTTRVAFTLPRPARAGAHDVALEVFDAQGRRVAALAPPVTAAGAGGTVSLAWEPLSDDGRALPSGVYVLRVAAPSAGFRAERKIVVLR
jgi:hypothetical protein